MIIHTDVSWGPLAPLASLADSGSYLGALPRKSVYGAARGLKPVGDYPDLLVSKSDLKDVIEDCHRKQKFPMYHQADTWCPNGTKWYQNGLNYCWSWSLSSCVMDVQAIEGKRVEETPKLAPVSLGRVVSWRNAGNYLESGIQGATKYGIATEVSVPEEYQFSRNPSNYASEWQGDALLNRLAPDSVWDTNNESRETMTLHCLTILSLGRPLYAAWYRLRHAMAIVGMEFSETAYGNVIWLIRNSHGETEPLKMDGRNAVPSEAFGIHATLNI